VFGRLASFSSGTGDFDKIGFLDPFRTGANSLGWQATFSSMNSLRLDNTVAYVTPNWGGFSAGVGYTFNAQGGENAGGSDENNTGVVSYISYGNGPFYGVVTYDTFDLGRLANEPSQDHLQVGVSWDFKIFKLSAAYAQESEQYALGPAGMAFGTPSATANTAAAVQVPGTDATAWAIGAIIPFGAHRINLSYQNRSADSLGAVGEGNRDGYALGYEYSFSRRTTLYVYYGEVSDDDTYKSGNWGGIKQTFLGLSHTF
jgi:predicted porin